MQEALEIIIIIRGQECKSSSERALFHTHSAGGGEGAGPGAEGARELVAQLVAMVPLEPRKAGGPFLLAVDHCFSMRGQGTVLTGTVLSGSLQARVA